MLKKRFIGWSIFCLLLLSVLEGKSQNFNAGLVAGANFSQVDGDNYGGYNKLGFCGGMFVNRNIKDKWRVQAEFLYTQKGSRNPFDKTNATLFILQLNYLEVPILAQYQLTDKIGFEAGLGMGVLIKNQLETNFGIGPGNFKPYEVSAKGGIEYRLTEKIAAHARYSYSVVSIAGTTFTNPQFFRNFNILANNVLSFSLRYYFN